MLATTLYAVYKRQIHMRKPGEEIPAGSLPVTYAVDMNPPIARQVRAGVGTPSLLAVAVFARTKRDSRFLK